MKIWCFKLHLALVSCQNLDSSWNSSQVISVQKVEFLRWAELVKFQLFQLFEKNACLCVAVIFTQLNPQKTKGYQWKGNVHTFHLITTGLVTGMIWKLALSCTKISSYREQMDFHMLRLLWLFVQKNHWLKSKLITPHQGGGGHNFYLFLPATPLAQSQTLEEFLELTRHPSRAVNLASGVAYRTTLTQGYCQVCLWGV